MPRPTEGCPQITGPERSHGGGILQATGSCSELSLWWKESLTTQSFFGKDTAGQILPMKPLEYTRDGFRTKGEK